MVHSTFDFELVECGGKDFMMIVDLNLGATRVTDDIENVIQYIKDLEQINPACYNIIQQDTNGKWNGYDAVNKNFICFNTETLEDAIKAFNHLGPKNMEKGNLQDTLHSVPVTAGTL